MTLNATEDIVPGTGRDGGPGERLRAAREAQNLAVAEVARQLKLSVNQVEALEAGEFERLPGPVFVRGFVRNYARLLKLDVAPLLKGVAARLPHEEPRPAAPPSQEIPFPTAAPRRWRAYVVALAVIVAFLAAYEFLLGGGATLVTHTPTAPQAPLAVTPSPAPPPSREAPQSAEPPSGEPGVPAPGEAAAPSPGGSADAATGQVAAAPAIAAAAAATTDVPVVEAGAARDDAATPAPGERQIRMVFHQDSWVEIRDRSGKPIFSRLNRSGTEQRVNGRPPLAVVVGNARGVRMTYDERPVDLLQHTKVDVARLTLE